LVGRGDANRLVCVGPLHALVIAATDRGGLSFREDLLSAIQ
jgi:hypothetical protein